MHCCIGIEEIKVREKAPQLIDRNTQEPFSKVFVYGRLFSDTEIVDCTSDSAKKCMLYSRVKNITFATNLRLTCFED